MDNSKFIVGMLNVCTLSTPSKQLELEEALKKIHADIFVVTEARLPGVGSFTLTSTGKVVLHSGGLTRNKGVAFIIDSTLAAKVKFNPVNDRIATLFIPNMKLFIVAAYAPTSSAPANVYDEFLELLELQAKSAPKRSKLVIAGDFNARVGRSVGNESVIGPYTPDQTNDRGEMLTTFCLANNLRIWNSWLPKRKTRQWTWRSNAGNCYAQIDFFLGDPNLPVTDAYVHRRFPFCSDHRPVFIHMKLIKNHKRKKRHSRQLHVLDRTALRINSKLLKPVLPPANILTSTEAYAHIVSFAHTITQNAKIPKKTTPWMSEETKKLLKERSRLQKDPDDDTLFKSADKAARASLNKDISLRKNQAITEAILRGRSFSKARRKTQPSFTRLLIPDKNGHISQISTTTSVKTFYEELYRARVEMPPNIPPSDDALLPFLPEEIEKALEQLKFDHSPGKDAVLPDALRIAKHVISPILTHLLNKLICGGPIPNDLVHATVTLLHKKGPLSDISNFRPISMLSVIFKVITKTVMLRMEHELENFETPTQYGFRRGRNTRNCLHILKQLGEHATEYKFPLFIALLDFQKAFDCVEHPAIWTTLSAAGIHSDLVHLLCRLYQHSTTEIRVNEDKVKVQITRGVRQGDALSPKLFNIVLNSALTAVDWEESGLNINGRRLQFLAYADDLAVVAKSRHELKKTIEKIAEECAKVGLVINYKKSEILTNRLEQGRTLRTAEGIIDCKDSVRYLGAMVSLPPNDEAEVKNRLRGAWCGWEKLRKYLTDKTIPMTRRKQLFDACITSTALYGCEVWALREKEKRLLDVTLLKMERRMIGIKLENKWKNEKVQAKTGLKRWVSEIVKRKLRWADKIRKMEHEEWTRTTTEWTPYDKKRGKGQPCSRWRDEVYVKGEFVGGCDIMVQMHKEGEISDFLDEKHIVNKYGNYKNE